MLCFLDRATVSLSFIEIPGGKIRFFCEGLYTKKWSPGLNTLITDEVYDGVIIKLGKNFNRLSVLNSNIIISGTAVLDKKLSDFAAENSLSGIEFLSCKPGTVGGGLKMNAGCFGTEIKDILVSIQAVEKNGNI